MLQVIALVLAGCGSNAAEPGPVRTPPPDTEWIVTHDVPPEGPGPLRAQRFRDGVLLSVDLSSRSHGGFWLPDGEHYVYTEATEATASGPLLLRSLTDTGWSEPMPLDAPQVASFVASPTFSPAGDAFVVSRYTSGSPGTESVVVYTELPSGELAAHDLNISVSKEQVRPWWSPDGLVLVTHYEGRAMVHLRSGASWRDLELAPPPGLEVGAWGVGAQGIGSPISPDGRFAALGLRSADRVTTEYLYPLDSGEPHPIEGCTSTFSRTESCRVYGWIGSSPSRLLLHRRDGGSARFDHLVVYDADTRTTTTLDGNLIPQNWILEGRALIAEQDGAMVLVDFSDPAPRVVPLADRRSYVGLSPDGRWCFVGAGSQRTVLDLSSSPPWPTRPAPPWANGAAYFAPDGVHAWHSDPARRSVRLERTNLQTLGLDRFEIPLGPVPSTWTWKLEGRFSADHTHLLVPRDGALAVWAIGTPLETAWPLGDTPEWSTPRWRPAR